MSTYYAEKPKRSYDVPLADISARFFAVLIDGLIIAFIASVLGLGSRHGMVWGGAGFVVGLLYQWYFLTQQDGQTLGKKIMNIRVVKTNGAPLVFTDVLVRYFVFCFLGIGALLALFDANRQTLHDLLASTVVIRA